ncbi:MAG: hypothetical protein H8D45_01630 [Bacteroidetes bacterium]|nr:hypothetical protein [Bacteroidota bacterium]
MSDYDYFVERILKPLCLKIPPELWQEAVEKPVNVSSRSTFPHWPDWDHSLKEKFVRICGDEIVANGYEL